MFPDVFGHVLAVMIFPFFFSQFEKLGKWFCFGSNKPTTHILVDWVSCKCLFIGTSAHVKRSQSM